MSGSATCGSDFLPPLQWQETTLLPINVKQWLKRIRLESFHHLPQYQRKTRIQALSEPSGDTPLARPQSNAAALFQQKRRECSFAGRNSILSNANFALNSFMDPLDALFQCREIDNMCQPSSCCFRHRQCHPDNFKATASNTSNKNLLSLLTSGCQGSTLPLEPEALRQVQDSVSLPGAPFLKSKCLSIFQNILHRLFRLIFHPATLISSVVGSFS
ncbi:hypothetical protein NPIL_699071 [Nephila pilipes]|uniref:Uncharacterized protein n=1 Tax=Nephila pilipes TaxID=299642 RepID=A0A8X6PEZ0_NEPPI|nr:hypothetical protein NPIL_699071 [Nephila pilipes]